MSSRSRRTHDARNRQKSRNYGVTGVPTFVHDGQGVVGAQPYEALVELIR
jgi:predicted DsbA family dithiol-disulfide isomerase